MIAAFVDFLVASTVFVGLMLFYHVSFQLSALWIPLLLAIQVVLTLGVVLPAVALNVWYRDIRFVVPLGLQLWMFATPIIYPVTMVPERLHAIYMLNPMAVLIESYRRVVLHGQSPPALYLITAGVIAVALFLIGYVYFRRSEDTFADII